MHSKGFFVRTVFNYVKNNSFHHLACFAAVHHNLAYKKGIVAVYVRVKAFAFGGHDEEMGLYVRQWPGGRHCS